MDVDVHGSFEGGSSFVAGSGSSHEGLIVSVGASQESFGLSHESLVAGMSHSLCASAVVVVVSC